MSKKDIKKRSTSTPKSAYDTALRLLAVRQRSKEEIRKRLTEKQFSEHEITETIERLCEYNLLDDEQFAVFVCESILKKKPSGPRLLLARLLQHGVSRQMAERVIDHIMPAEQELQMARKAVDLHCARVRVDAESDRRTVQARAARHLASRGFSSSIIRETILEKEF